jgi:hypothetical protein
VIDGDLLHPPEASSPLPDKKDSVKEKKATEIRLNDDVSTSTEVERE